MIPILGPEGEILNFILRYEEVIPTIKIDGLLNLSGTTLYSHAADTERQYQSRHNRESRAKYLTLYELARESLEGRVAQINKGDTEREDMLKLLQTCYQKLAVETSLPDIVRTVGMPLTWKEYAGRLVEISGELSAIKR